MSTLSQRPTVLVTDNIHAAAVALLEPTCNVVYHAKLTPEALQQALAQADAILIRSASQLSADALAHAPHLKIIGRAGVGVDNVDLRAATQRGIVVVNSPEGNTIAASEHTLGLLFALARHIPQGDASLKAHQWQRSQWVGTELYGKTLGIIGLGKIGSRVAKVALAVGMQVIVFDPFLSDATAKELGVIKTALNDLWPNADYISLHAPQTAETKGMVNPHTLAQCKPGVRFINCARGGLIDEAAMATALQSGHVAGFASDVFEQEPPEFSTHPYFQLGQAQHRVVLTPHLGASTEEAQVNVALDVATQVRDFFAQGFARHAVNLPGLKASVLDPVRAYMPMAEMLGSVAYQLFKGFYPNLTLAQIELTACGQHLGQVDPSPLQLAALKGLLTHSQEHVSYVNAALLASDMGLSLKTSTTANAGNYVNQIRLLLGDSALPQNQLTVAATLIGEGHYRLVEINGYQSLIEPSASLLFAPHHDQPGMVAGLSSLLGQADININALQVGRLADGSASMMIFNLDRPIPAELLHTMSQQPGIHAAVFVGL